MEKIVTQSFSEQYELWTLFSLYSLNFFQFNFYNAINVLYLFTIRDILATIKSIAWSDFKVRKPFDYLRQKIYFALDFSREKKQEAWRWRLIIKLQDKFDRFNMVIRKKNKCTIETNTKYFDLKKDFFPGNPFSL